MNLIDLSLNEYQAAVFKAARGCGFAVGLAEELVGAVAWLAEQEQDSAQAVLTALATGPQASLMGMVGPRLATTAHGFSLIDGPALFELAAASDCAATDQSFRAMLTNVDAPLLVLAYAGKAAIDFGMSVEVDLGNGARALVDASDLNLKGSVPTTKADMLIVCEFEPQLAPINKPTPRIQIEPADWQQILSLAAKTYVPATAESRLKGAGEGTQEGLTERD